MWRLRCAEVRYGRPGSADGTSLCRSGIGAIHRADPSGLFGRPPPPSAAPHGAQDQETEQEHFALARAWFLFVLTFGPPRVRRVRAGKSPQGRAQDARAFAVGTWTCRQRTSGADSRSRQLYRRPRPRGCPFSWLLLFGQALRRRSGANGEAGPKGGGQDARSQEK